MGATNLGQLLPCRAVAVPFLLFLASGCGGTDKAVGPGFPTDEAATLAELVGPVLHRADGSTVDVNVAGTKALVGLYFAGGWCSGCGVFTPTLVGFYKQLRQANKSFEVVFISFDESSSKMFSYMRSYGMPWLATPYSRAHADGLADRFGVRFIPTLVIIDPSVRTISTSGREEVDAKGAAAFDDWMAEAGGK